MDIRTKKFSGSTLKRPTRTQTGVRSRSSVPQEERRQHGSDSSESGSSQYSDARESFSTVAITQDPVISSPQVPSIALPQTTLGDHPSIRRAGKPTITAEQRLIHENLVEDKSHPESFSKKARRALMAKASTFGTLHSEDFIDTAAVTANTNAAIRELQTAVTRRSSGLTKVQVSGTLVLNGEDTEHLAKILGRGPVAVTAITPDRLRQLHEEGHLKTTMASFLKANTVSMYLENEQAVRTHLPASASSRHPIRLRQFARLSSVFEAQKIRHLHETGLTSIGCALACSCLRHNEYDLFAEIIAVAPRRLMHQLTTFPFEGNILSPEAILALICRLSPENSREMLQSESGQSASEAIFLSLKHYFKYSPVTGLRRHLPKALSLQRRTGENSDLLIQNHLKFASEVAFLGERLLHSAYLSRPATLLEASRVGAQTALLVGNSFQYAIEFCEGLKKDKKALLSKIGTGVEIAKVALSTVGAAVPATESASAGAVLGATKIGEIIARWATEPSQEMNIPKMAAQLARLSDAYLDRSRDALLVPGDLEMDLTELREAERNESPEAINSLEVRKLAAAAFHEAYQAHLANFKKRYLESSLADLAP